MKFMNTKRFASTVMAGVLTLSLAAPAFAASTQPKNSTVVEGTYKIGRASCRERVSA